MTTSRLKAEILRTWKSAWFRIKGDYVNASLQIKVRPRLAHKQPQNHHKIHKLIKSPGNARNDCSLCQSATPKWVCDSCKYGITNAFMHFCNEKWSRKNNIRKCFSIYHEENRLSYIKPNRTGNYKEDDEIIRFDNTDNDNDM